MAMRDLSVLWEDEDLLVKHLEGNSPSLGVTFSGIGFDEGETQKPEFVATASQGNLNHVLFVMDRKRSWFSTPGLQEKLVSVVRKFIADHAITKVHCIGNSMGGFGALAFADSLGADYAIAFAPQFSMDPAVITDRRWEKFRPFMHPETMPRLADAMTEKVRYYLLYGEETAKDLQHGRMFVDTGRVWVRVLADTNHHVGNRLRELRLLQPIKMAIANKNHTRLDALLKPHLAAASHFA